MRRAVLNSGGMLALAACALGLSGCYEQTVSAKGLGSTGTRVHEPYRSETALDRAWDDIFGNKPAAKAGPPVRDPGQNKLAEPKTTVEGR